MSLHNRTQKNKIKISKMPSKTTSKALKAVITIQQALELDALLEISEEECDQLFADVKPVVDQPIDGESRWTLLHLAAAHGRLDFCKRLIQAGAHLNLTDVEDKTPYFLCPDDADELRELLKTHGAIDKESYFKKENIPDFKSEGFMNANFFRKLLIVFIVPFLVLLFVNGVGFAVKFLLATLFFYFIAAGYFVTELTVRPVWYNYKPGAKSLSLNNLPEEWRGTYHDPKFHFDYDFENVTFESHDDGDYTYSGWYVPGRVGPGVPKRVMGLVCTHGGGRDRRAWLRHLPMFHDAGFSVLLYDLREHGLSSGSGKGFTYSIKERFDVKAACRFMKEVKGFKRVGAIGTSVGAASSIAGAAIAKEYIDLVIAENPMLTCSQLQSVLLHRIIGPLFRGTKFSRPIFWAFKKICSIYLNARVGNIPSKKCQPMHVVSQIAPRPLLLMHGTFDTVVPAAHGQRLFDLAQEPKEFWLLPEAGHTTLYDHSPEEFKTRVMGFLEKYEKGDYKMPTSPSIASSGSFREQQRPASVHYEQSRIPRNLRSRAALDDDDISNTEHAIYSKRQESSFEESIDTPYKNKAAAPSFASTSSLSNDGDDDNTKNKTNVSSPAKNDNSNNNKKKQKKK